MGLTGAQMAACFQSYWSMWLTNGLCGLVMIGIQIGIAVFFIRKMVKNSVPPPRPGRVRQPARPVASATNVSVSHVNLEAPPVDGYPLRDASAVSTESAAEADNRLFAQSTLQAINAARNRHGAAPVVLNEEIAAIAQSAAENMARHCKLEHTPPEMRTYQGQILGENYMATFQSELTGTKMVTKWMKEGRRYMFGYDGRRDNENFTQLVWRSTQQIGVGRARSEDGNWWYGVVMFDPAGNLPGQFSFNVLLPAE